MSPKTCFRILFIAGTLGQGGSERQLFYILKELRGLEFDTRVISLSRGQYWEKPIRKLGIQVYWPGGNKNQLFKLISILNLAHKYSPSVIQSQHFYTNVYTSITGRLLNRIDIGAIRSNGIFEIENNGKLVGGLCLHLPKYLAANSLMGIQFAKSVGIPSNRLRYLPNVVDTQIFSPNVKQHKNGQITLLLVSNLYMREKRVDLFIDAVSQLEKLSNTPFSALIIGDGPLKSELKQLAHKKGLNSEKIRFLGSIKKIENIYKQADILVHTSEREGTPNVILEAMSCGLPVVATSVGGVPDLVQDGESGFLVPPGDAKSLAKKLAILIDEPVLMNKMGEIGRYFVISHHSLDNLPFILTEFYSSL